MEVIALGATPVDGLHVGLNVIVVQRELNGFLKAFDGRVVVEAQLVEDSKLIVDGGFVDTRHGERLGEQIFEVFVFPEG